jgi:hypothetical protein
MRRALYIDHCTLLPLAFGRGYLLRDSPVAASSVSQISLAENAEKDLPEAGSHPSELTGLARFAPVPERVFNLVFFDVGSV